ncbi:uncharacterized protein EV422DRAFT_502345 [Fimicolochytrium jonesii]|uniref:uncharacterized protein n=1 Tax=Fimicolochytrium jonesii TaxID=1396493 RepID=UPI0022FDD948|nr:uncharacterized protein EV422DRAFT_502345 [Fimicolochytrium jonesii]KAI8826560.1 hypothetical protein EV422DRAFT_502345 [Fimicolochytrium jonesii]
MQCTQSQPPPPIPPSLLPLLTTRGFHVHPTWLSECVAYLRSSAPAPITTDAQLLDNVVNQILLTDLKSGIITRRVIPGNVGDAHGVVLGADGGRNRAVVLQVEDVMEVGVSKHTLLEMVIDQKPKKAEPGMPPTPGMRNRPPATTPPRVKLPRKMLRLVLTDGFSCITAMECGFIPGLSVDMPLGVKVGVEGGMVRRGVLLLHTGVCRVWGGGVAEMNAVEPAVRLEGVLRGMVGGGLGGGEGAGNGHAHPGGAGTVNMNQGGGNENMPPAMHGGAGGTSKSTSAQRCTYQETTAAPTTRRISALPPISHATTTLAPPPHPDPTDSDMDYDIPLDIDLDLTHYIPETPLKTRPHPSIPHSTTTTTTTTTLIDTITEIESDNDDDLAFESALLAVEHDLSLTSQQIVSPSVASSGSTTSGGDGTPPINHNVAVGVASPAHVVDVEEAPPPPNKPSPPIIKTPLRRRRKLIPRHATKRPSPTTANPFLDLSAALSPGSNSSDSGDEQPLPNEDWDKDLTGFVVSNSAGSTPSSAVKSVGKSPASLRAFYAKSLLSPAVGGLGRRVGGGYRFAWGRSTPGVRQRGGVGDGEDGSGEEEEGDLTGFVVADDEVEMEEEDVPTV